MPNAKDLKGIKPPPPKILAVGEAGAGKTTQFLTLPGKKFIYLFDPNAINSLIGYDVDYEEFYPDKLNLALTSLSKGKGASGSSKGAEVYRAWEKDFETKRESGFFIENKYDWIGFDSFTTLGDMVMDGILAVNGRGGLWPQQDDYAPQMLALTAIMRTATSLGIGVYVTGHIETKQDQTTKKILTEPMMTGRLKKKIPLLFSELLYFDNESDIKKGVKYVMHTVPTTLLKGIRTSMKGVDSVVDVSIDFNKPLTSQGLGGIMRDFGII